MPYIDNLLERLSEDQLDAFIENPSSKLRLLRELNLVQNNEFKKVVFAFKSPLEILSDHSSYKKIIDLLTEEEARQLCQFIGIDYQQDVKKTLQRLKIRRNSERQKQILDFFGVGYPSTTTSSYRIQETKVDALYSLFSHQRKAANKVIEQLYVEPRRVLLHMPTGSGKTRTSMHIVSRHLQKNDPSLVVWLSSSSELCEQAYQEFSKAWNILGNRQVSVLKFWRDYEIRIEDIENGDGFFVAGLSKLFNCVKNGNQLIRALGLRSSLIIFDEAHQIVAPTYQLLVENLIVPFSKNSLLGLTATPGRTWSDIDEDSKLSDFFFRRKVSLSIEGFENPVDYLVKEGYLAKVEYKTLFCQSGLKLSRKDIDYLEKELELPQKASSYLAEDIQRNLKIVLQIEELLQRHQRIIVFALSVEHSELLTCILKLKGYIAESITQRTEADDRDRIIAQYKSDLKVPMVLFNYGVLTTGFDAPKTSAALITRPTRSLVLYSQMIGRAIRGIKAGGNHNAEVITVVDMDLPGFRNMAESFVNWEDVWRLE